MNMFRKFLLPILQECSLIEHMLGLACRTFDVAWFLDVDVWLDAHQTDDAVVEWFDEWHLLRWVGREVFCTQLDIEVEGVFVVLAIHGDEILWGEYWEFGQHGLNLRWEDVHTTYDEHIVATTQNLSEADRCTSTLTRLIDEVGEVSCTITEDRHCFLAQRSEHQLTFFTWLTCLQPRAYRSGIDTHRPHQDRTSLSVRRCRLP